MRFGIGLGWFRWMQKGKLHHSHKLFPQEIFFSVSYDESRNKLALEVSPANTLAPNTFRVINLELFISVLFNSVTINFFTCCVLRWKAFCTLKCLEFREIQCLTANWYLIQVVKKHQNQIGWQNDSGSGKCFFSVTLNFSVRKQFQFLFWCLRDMRRIYCNTARSLK